MRIFFSLLASFFLVLSFSHSTFAVCDATTTGAVGTFIQGCAEDSGAGIDPSTLGGSSPTESVKIYAQKVGQRAIEYGALFAIGVLVFSGIRYTTSFGDDEKLKKAKSTAIYALIGLVLLLVAFPLVDIVVNFIYNLSS